MKVTVVGAGNVGASTCFLLASKNICSEIVSIDIAKDIAFGKSLDIAQSCAALGNSTVVKSCNYYSEISGSKIVVITAGSPRKPGMSREDLLNINASIISDITKEIKKYAPDSIIVVVSNPLDVMTYVALKQSGFDKNRVIGMGGILDSARMSNVISEKVGFANGQVNSLVIGTHGEGMLPLCRFSSINGVNLELLFDKDELEDIIDKTKNGGAKIVQSLGTSAYYAPAASICVLVEAILNNKKTVQPCSVLLEGEYKSSNVCVGVPIVLGSNGVEKIIELPLNSDENEKLNNSVNAIKEMIEVLKI